jgi:hypothetical protein
VQVGSRLGSSGRRQLPLWPLSLRSAGRLDSRGAGTRAIDSRTCSRLAVASVCPCVGPCGGPWGAGGVCGPVVVWTSCFITGFRSRMGGPVRTGCGSASGVAECQTEPLVDCRPRPPKGPCGNPPSWPSARQPCGTRLNPQALISLRVPHEFAWRGCLGLRGWRISTAGWGRRANRRLCAYRLRSELDCCRWPAHRCGAAVAGRRPASMPPAGAGRAACRPARCLDSSVQPHHHLAGAALPDHQADERRHRKLSATDAVEGAGFACGPFSCLQAVSCGSLGTAVCGSWACEGR